jgi:hypothetical protein
MKPHDMAYLMARVSPEPNTGCWLWTERHDARGYGRYGKNGKAHRLSFALHHSDPGELSVLHRCDQPACVNPEHLFAGTQADNMRDMFRKKRNKVGHGRRSVLVGDSVERIRALARSGVMHKDIAAMFGVTRPHISKVVGKTRGVTP